MADGCFRICQEAHKLLIGSVPSRHDCRGTKLRYELHWGGKAPSEREQGHQGQTETHDKVVAKQS